MTCGYRNCQSRACGSTVRPDGHELAYCVAHEAIARHLPPLRSARCCTSEGCGRPQGSRSPLCKSCRPRYAAWGLDGYPVPQEAPMTEPTPEAHEAQTPPPAAPQDAAGGVTTQSGGYLACITPGCGDEDLMDLDQTTGLCGMCSRQKARESKERDYEDNYVPVSEPVPAAPADDAARWRPMTAAEVEAAVEKVMPLDVPDAPPATVEEFLCDLESGDGEPSAADVDDAPLFVGGTDSAPMQPMSPDLAALATDPMQQRREAVVARLLALGFKEHEGTDTSRMFLGHGWSVPIPLPGHDAGPRKVEDMLDDAERLCRRLCRRMEKPEPTAPGPTLAEVQAELARERERADRAELDAVQERARADEALEELATIAAMLDPEDAPAYDSDDQPIPLPTRVRTALMPHSESVLVRGLRAERDAFWGIINDTEWIVHHCGSYGATASLADRVLRLLPAERQRAILELKRSEAYIDVARLQARFLSPPPPGRLEEYAAKVAEVEAKIAALDAGEVKA